MFEPSLAFVAEDAAGVGGYVLGALDSQDFEARLERDWWPKLRAGYPETPAGLPEDRWTREQAKAHLIHHPWVTPGELAAGTRRNCTSTWSPGCSRAATAGG